jgi:epoxide hydrolase-like predicted phosphatase
MGKDILKAIPSIQGSKFMKQRTTIKAVLWDMGGVILRTEDFSFRKKWANKFNMDEKKLAKIVFENEKSREATLGRVSDDEVWKWIGKEFQLSAQEENQFQNEYFAGDRMDWDLLKQIQELRSRCKTGLLSNAWKGAHFTLDSKYPGWNVFDYIFFSAEIQLMKPDQKIFQHVLSFMKVLPEETIFVDDQIGNIEAAEKSGILAIRFQNPEQAMKDIIQSINH